ncbi:MAG TPA: energy transducer TonB [Gammaproteobacteria bacterium]|jgi:protein TonB
MWLARISLTAVAGFGLSAGLFWVLWHLVGAEFDVNQLQEATRIDFTRMRRDTETVTKRDVRVERERPPIVPEVPRMAFSTGALDNNIATLSPVVDARGAMSRMSLTAGSDQDVLPLVRIAPEYPARAAARGIEGWVIVQFTITPTGSVRDPIVVEAMPKNVFDDAALKAIARWRYNPKIEGGVAVERVGVRTIIRFVLEQG